MIKKTIDYIDYDGNQKSEDCHFHLSKSALVKMEVSIEGGLKNRLEKVIKSNDNKEIISIFESIILNSYGVKTDENHFVQSKELTDAFMQSPAYDALFMTLIQNETEMIQFINGIVPADLANQA